jgi:DNA modification methylase
MKIEIWDVDAVRPYKRNPRNNDAAVAPVAAAIEKFGFRQPIVVDVKGVIIVGHVRWQAAQKLGLKKVPVHVARELSAAQARAYRLADNKLHEIATWNFEDLSIELRALKDAGMPLGLLGFDEAELIALLQTTPAADLDDVPAPPDEATTRSGDLWILGEHRLLCGDSANPADVARATGGRKIHLLNTDPPYNVKVEPRSNNAIRAAGKRTHHQSLDAARRPGLKATTKKLRAKDRPLANDFLPPAEFERLLGSWFANAAGVMVPGASMYVWGGYANVANYPPALAAAGMYFAQAIIWVKEHPVMTRKDFMGNHEWCFYGWREGGPHRWFGPRNLTDVWHVAPAKLTGRDRARPTDAYSRSIGKGVRLESPAGSRIDVMPPAAGDLPTVPIDEQGVTLFGANNLTDVWSVKKVASAKMVHLTEKPVELAARAMRLSSKPGENVLDLFGGSGSTLIAAQANGRRAVLLEMDALYCDVIVQRWENLTGKKAKLERKK